VVENSPRADTPYTAEFGRSLLHQPGKEKSGKAMDATPVYTLLTTINQIM
jgi:hypothetical protein